MICKRHDSKMNQYASWEFSQRDSKFLIFSRAMEIKKAEVWQADGNISEELIHI